MSATKTHGVHYAWIAAAVMGAVAVVAWLVTDQWLAFSAAILGLYVLHLMSVRYIVQAHADQLAALTGSDSTSRAPALPGDEEASTSEGLPQDSSAQLELEPEAWSEAESDGEPETRGEVDGEPMGAEVDGDRDGEPASPSADADQPADDAEDLGSPIKEVAIPRHFMLGTVAIVRSVMEPEAVARVLMEQRQQPGKRFGELAVDMGLITEDQLEMLLEAQQRGLFTDAEIREARQRLETFRRAQTEPAASA